MRTALGPVELALDSDSVSLHPRDPERHTRWGSLGLHVEHPRSRCVVEFDAPRRVYLHLGPLGSVLVGLPHRDDGGRWSLTTAQRWSPRAGWRNGRRGVVTWSPHRNLCCDHRVGDAERCAAWRWHTGPHSTP